MTKRNRTKTLNDPQNTHRKLLTKGISKLHLYLQNLILFGRWLFVTIKLHVIDYFQNLFMSCNNGYSLFKMCLFAIISI